MNGSRTSEESGAARAIKTHKQDGKSTTETRTELPAAARARKGQAGRFAPLPAAPAAGRDIGSSEESGGGKETR